MKIKKNDIVKIIAGKEKGKTGKVLRVFPDEGKIIIEGLNIIKKHSRPKKEREKGQRLEVPGKINISNVKIVCPKCGQSVRLGYKIINEKKIRVCKKCREEI